MRWQHRQIWPSWELTSKSKLKALRSAHCWEQHSGLHKGSIINRCHVCVSQWPWLGLPCFTFAFFWRRWKVAVQAWGTPENLTSTAESASHAHLPLKVPPRDGGGSYCKGRKSIPSNWASVRVISFDSKSNKTYFGHSSLFILPRVHTSLL